MKILLVDDSVETVELFAAFLSHRGYEIARAYDGAEALVSAKRDRPNLILMDVEMPRMSGLSACRLLRADPAFERIPIVLLTSREDPETIVRGLSSGANDYILKTAPREEIVARISRHLSMHASFQAHVSEERLTAISQIALSIQHEIFNPLTSMVGFIELSLRYPNLPDRVRKYLETARSEAGRIEGIVSRLTTVEDRPVNPFGVGDMIDLGDRKQNAAD